MLARALVHIERFCLATVSIKREHQLPTESLAERMGSDQFLQLADEPGVETKSEFRIDAKLDRVQTKLVETCDRRLGERFVREVRERGPAPKCLRLAQHAHGGFGIAVDKRPTPILEHALEGAKVESIGGQPNQITAAAREQHSVA